MLESCGIVSTHSRPKAAGFMDYRGVKNERAFQLTAARRRLGKKEMGL